MRSLTILLPLIPLIAGAAMAPLEAIDQARRLAAAFETDFHEQMDEALDGHGPAEVCRTRAPAMAARLSIHGWRVRRVSLTALNPAHRPDAWEREILQRFGQLMASGEEIGNLEIAEFVRQGDAQTFRYIRAIASHARCLGCHGRRPPPRGQEGPDPQAPGAQGLGGALSLSRDIDG